MALHHLASVSLAHGRGVFMISIAAELADMHPQTLRGYEARGLLSPQRSPRGTRLYSQADVERLRHIRELAREGLSLAGVERVLALESEVEALRQRLGGGAGGERREGERDPGAA
jgi:MerR family transcriptional regulator/heat shock protein HspR